MISIEDDLPKKGVEVLLYNKNWINEDFTPPRYKDRFFR